ncbi:SigE family RNA polymerase sigma factor [Phytohabitans kaempferiae]|uniref:SigE family RNA polymerase sigma factor n=1 Tax=Phytohabitans kaempferiae TaxID=1620943 RepID=A0ABV6M0L4_9ACTN
MEVGRGSVADARQELEEEFREFVAARSAALLRTAYLLAGDWATAEDLLQTALTKTYLAWKRLGEIEAVEPYARRVLVNTATSWWRRRWHGERPTEILPERAAPDQIDEQLERDALWRHVKALPARQRAVLVLRFYEDLTEAQTAALLDISTGTVKSQTSRALNTLRQRLGADGLAPGLDGAGARGGAAAERAPAGKPAEPRPARRPAPVVPGLPMPSIPAPATGLERG